MPQLPNANINISTYTLTEYVSLQCVIDMLAKHRRIKEAGRLFFFVLRDFDPARSVAASLEGGAEGQGSATIGWPNTWLRL